MDRINTRSVRITLKILIVLFVIVGVIYQNLVGYFAGRGFSSYLYFTTQSNIIIGALAMALLVYDLKRRQTPKALVAFHHIAISAIMLTFIVFALFLGPLVPDASYFYSPSNLTLHNLVPILAFFNYLLEEDEMPPRYVRYLALISGVSYMIATYIFYFSGASFGQNEFPYFFLNFKTNGWLTIDFVNWRFGIIYWWVVIVLVLLGISVATYEIKAKCKKNQRIAWKIFIFLLSLATIFILMSVIIKLSMGVALHETSIKVLIR